MVRWFVGGHSLITCSDYVFKSVNLLYLPNAEVSCINGLSAVCQGKLTLCNDQLINSQIAPLKCVPVIKSLPYPSTAQHPPSSPTHPVSSILPDLHPDGLFTAKNMHVTWLARSLLVHVDVRPLRKIAQ